MHEGKSLRNKLHSGAVCLGTWVNFTDPTLAELLCSSGYDFLMIDSEHSAMDIESVQRNVMATKGTDVAPMVRVPWNDQVLIKRVLDVGAAGILAPMVRTPEDVERAVAACLYPPAGIRGFGPRRPAEYERHFTDYIASANDSLVIWVQIEHIDAVNCIEEIVRVPRLDGVFVGSNDLSGSMGLLGQPRHPRVLEAIGKVIAAARGAGVAMGIAGPPTPADAYGWIEKGVQFITLGGDQGLLVQASQASVSGMRQLVSQEKMPVA
ncbi:MAG TPA: aldolase/citrate lyase family protein [Anaerolineae bacterium]